MNQCSNPLPRAPLGPPRGLKPRSRGGIRGSEGPPRAPALETSLLSKLSLRERQGHLRSRRAGQRASGTSSKLFTRLPGRLAFCLKDVVPMSAIEAGHVFLGFSKCGQFLLSYTQTTADVDLVGCTIYYHYRLHWWLFLPYKRSKKVAEMLLFSNEGASELLHLSFCQWPGNDKQLVVFGYPLGSTEDAGMHDGLDAADSPMASRSCYLTVTAVPSLNGCKECVRVAATYEEEDVAEAWNSCVRLSCLEHGLTIHTGFDLVPPFPKFEPKICLKRDNYVLINTGNLLHSVYISLEKLTVEDNQEVSPQVDLFDQTFPRCLDELIGSKTKIDPCRQWSELNVATGSEFTLYGGEVFSPPPTAALWSPGSSVTAAAPAAYHLAASDSETTDCESEYGNASESNKKKRRNTQFIQNQERLDQVSAFVDQLIPPSASSSQHQMMTRRKRSLWQRIQGASEAAPCTKRMEAAEKAYELTDDDFDVDGIREKLSTFRKKRLAEKTYEFKDEDDSENITPLHKLRSQKSDLLPEESSSVAAATLTEEAHAADDENVLQPILENQGDEEEVCFSEEVSGLMVDTMPVPELLSPGGMVKKESAGGSAVIHSPRSDQQPPKFHSKFTRRYIELDDELISVITDIDDEIGGCHGAIAPNGGYHTVLPLAVHGSGYQPMAMISRSKAEKLSRRCVQVQQRSLDLEVFCHYMAQRLCQAANKKYWFCNDYDVEVVDLDPVSGDLICVAVVLVKATIVTKRVSQATQLQQRYAISSLHRHQYQASFKFTWNIDSAQVSVIDSESLKEIGGSPSSNSGGVWHPAKSAAMALQRQWGVTNQHGPGAVKCFTNDPVLRGTSLNTIVDSDHLVAIIQDNLD